MSDDDVIEDETETATERIDYKLDVSPDELLAEVEQENDQIRRENRRLRAVVKQLVVENSNLKELVDAAAKSIKPEHNGRVTRGRKRG